MKPQKLMLLAAALLAAICYANHSQAQAGQPFAGVSNLDSLGASFDEIMTYIRSQVLVSDTGEGALQSQVEAFDMAWRGKVSRNDTLPNRPNMFQQYFLESQKAIAARGVAQCPVDGYSGNWRCIGPDSSADQNLAYIKHVWINPTDTSKLLAATAGGLFKSTDAGRNWSCITDNAPVSSGVVDINYIAVHPANTQIIYLATGNEFLLYDRVFGWRYSYGAGLIYTTNGGSSWQQDFPTTHTTLDYGDSVIGVNRVYFSPDGNRLYALVGNKLLYRQYPSGSWQDVTPAITGLGTFWSMEFVPGDPNHFFATTRYPAAVFEYTYSSGSHNAPIQISSNLPSITFNPPSGTVATSSFEQVDVSMPNTSDLYVAVRNLDPNNAIWNDITALLKYNLSSQAWTLVNNTLPDRWGLCNPCFSLGVSPANTSNIYFNTCRSFFSNDGGITFHGPLDQYGGYPTHGDFRSFTPHYFSSQSNGTGDRIYYASDGGVSMKPTNVNPWTGDYRTLKNINGKGLAAAHYTGIGSSEGGNFLVGGAFHVGFHAFEKDKQPQWLRVGGGDASGGIFSRTDPTKAFGDDNYFADFSESHSSGGRRIGGMSDPASFSEARVGPLPMWNDQFGNIYVGEENVWRWDATNGLIQVSGSGVNSSVDVMATGETGVPVNCMIFSPYFPGPTGYIVYRNGVINYKKQITTTTIPFTKQFGPTYQKGIPPNAVAMDPRIPERVWIAIGSLNWENTTVNRVKYSPNAGQNWFDISKGLPLRIPVMSLVFQEGTQYLYASTDAGIYRCDMTGFSYSDINDPMSAYNSVEWTCFNTGLVANHDFPNVFTPELEINYCDGKLYAATYGRSLWSCDLMIEDPNAYNPEIGDMVANQTEIISTNETWASDKIIYTGIRIKAGATLTIQNTSGQPQTVIHMPKNGAIVVEPGGKLIVDGAKITNDCGGFWKGILVEGDPSLPQRPESNQGVAEVKNGAIIEHARVGLGNNGESVEPNPLAVSGGIIRADGALFLNDARGIAFGPYHNKLGNVNLQNDSRISRCTFTVDNDYRGEALSYPFQAHIALSDVDGIYIGADTFKNLSTMPNTMYSGNAITTWNAGIMAVPECSTLTAPCPTSDYLHNYFQGFNIAVNVNSSATNYGSYSFIDYADFKDNGIGVYARYANDVQVFHSHFNLDQNGAAYAATCNCTKGIYLVQTPQFRIEEDTFTGYASGSSGNTRIREGVRIESCGSAENVVYRNSFDNVEYGAISKGVNRNKPSSQIYVGNGLQFVCNDIGYTNTGILVTPGNPSNGLDGIRRKQGEFTAGADNAFTPGLDTTLPARLRNNCDELWYLRGSSNPNTLVYHNKIDIGANVWLGVAGVNTCKPRLIRNPVTGYAGYTSSRPSFAAHVNAWQSATAALATKMNGGSLAGLLGKIDQSTDGIALGDTLFSLAPYLSDEVLRAAAANNKVPVDKMMQVLLACPEMLSEDLLEYLGFLMPGAYPEPYIDTLRAHRADVSIMSNDLTVIDTNYQGMTRDHQGVVWEILSDTNGVDIDTLAYWRKQLPEVWPRYQNALAYLGAHRYSDMQAVMSVIPDEFSLADESLDEYNTYQDVMNLLKGVYQGGRDELSLDSTELDSLLLYAELEHGAASYLAGNLRNQNLGITPLPCDTSYGSGTGGEQRIKRNEAPFAGTALHHEGLRVHPNPARDEVTFDYDFAGKREPLVLAISTAGGRLVYSAQLSGTSGSLRWNARSAAPGVYLYKITSGNKPLQAGKISVVR